MLPVPGGRLWPKLNSHDGQLSVHARRPKQFPMFDGGSAVRACTDPTRANADETEQI